MSLSICNVHTDSNLKELNSYGTLDFPLACYEDDMQKMNVPVHYHEEFEFIIATKGIVKVLVNGCQFELKKGDFLFINSGCLHAVETVTDRESLLRSLTVLAKFIGGTSENIIYKKIIAPFFVKGAPSYVLLNQNDLWQKEMKELLLKSWKAVQCESYDFENEARYFISKAMRIFSDHISDFKELYSQNSEIVKRIKFSIAYMQEHFSENINIQDLLDLTYCSESVFLRNFKKLTGTTPLKFLISFRLQKASQMLLATEHKSSAIAEFCGFSDNSYFTKIFRQNMGMTPLQYKKLYCTEKK